MSQKFTKILGLALIIGVGLFFYVTSQKNEPSHSSLNALSKAPTGGDFRLNSNNGSVSLSDFKGKWVYLYFGYTFCPDICPTNLGNLSKAYHQLTDTEKKQLQFIFISVDPNRDTPERLAEYSHYFDMNLIGLTGTEEQIAEISKRYGAVYISHQKKPDDEYYPVDHSAFTYVINPNGILIGQLPHGSDPNMFVKNIRHNFTLHIE